MSSRADNAHIMATNKRTKKPTKKPTSKHASGPVASCIRSIIAAAAAGPNPVSRFEISRQTGIEESALSRFMTGERGLSMKALDALFEYFGLEITKKGESHERVQGSL